MRKLICRLLGHRLPTRARKLGAPCPMMLTCARCRERFLAGE